MAPPSTRARVASRSSSSSAPARSSPASTPPCADLEVGDTATVTIPAADAYGEHSDEGLQTFPRDAFPPDADPEVGWAVELSAPDGQRVPATVAEVTDESITLDFNHPLAGQDLTFEITLVEIVE